jgi:23S rRNA pseudouridine1911/1915/1917 synthase
MTAMDETAANCEILYEDGRLVALNKPPGLSLATPARDPGAAVRNLLEALPPGAREAHGLAAEGLLLVHRLDAGTTGVVLLARDPECHRLLSSALARKVLRKTYVALVWGHPKPATGRWEWPLGPDRKDRRRMRVDPSGKAAASAYTTVRRAPHVTLVKLEPETGRTHQLRVHCAAAGHPIVGDDLYGGPRHRSVRGAARRAALAPSHPLLHAWRLDIPPLERAGELVLVAPPPRDFLAALEASGISPDVLDS